MRKLDDKVRENAKEMIEKKYKYIDKNIRSNKEVTEAYIIKECAWKKYKQCEEGEEKEKKWKIFKWTRNKAKKKIRKRIEERNRAVMKEIESLKTNNQKEYWKELQAISGGRKRKKTWETAIDQKGVEVAGDEVKLVWKAAYEKLGKEYAEEEKFDQPFAKEVESQMQEMEEQSKTRSLTEELEEDIAIE